MEVSPLSVLLLVVLGLVSYIFYHFVIKIYLAAAKFKKMDPSIKIFVAPFTGFLGIQKKNVEKYGDSHHFIKEIIKENPDQKAFLTNLGSRPFLILSQASLVKQVHLNAKKFRKFNLYKHSNKCYTKGIFLVEDQEWTSERTIIRHSFNHDVLKRTIPQITSSIDNFISRIKKQIDDEPTGKKVYNVLTDTQILIGQVLVRIFFSQDAINKKVGNKNLSIALADFTTTMYMRSRSATNILLQLFFGERVSTMNFSMKDKALQNEIIEIRKIITEILQARMSKEDRPDEQQDFLGHYIRIMRETDKQIEEAQKLGKPHNIRRVTVEQIMHQLISFYFAGIDTTGHLAAFALYCLAQYPQYRTRIQEQIKEKLPSTKNMTYDDLQKLEFTGKFMDECLRMWPPAVGILFRMTREDVKIGPYELPKGHILGTSIVALCNNPKYYDHPQIFDPDRWDPKGKHSIQPYSNIPFSAGSRSCIGKYLALMECKIIMIKFLNEFNFGRTDVPLSVHVRFLYEPVHENLVTLEKGGMQLS